MKKILIIAQILLSNILFAQTSTDYLNEYKKVDSTYMAIRENNLKEAFKLIMQKDSLAKLINVDSILLLSKFHKSQTLILLGFQDIALKELYEGLRKAEQKKNIYFQYRYNYSIGQVYADNGDLPNALKFYLKAKEKAIENHSLKDTLFINYDIGMNLFYSGDQKSAFNIISRNLEISKALEDSVSLFFGLDNMAAYYAMTGNMKESLKYDEEILKYPNTLNSIYRKNLLYQHLTALATELKDWKGVQMYCDSLYTNSLKFNSPEMMRYYYQTKAKIYEVQGKYKDAFMSHKRYVQLNDSLNRNNYNTKMSVMANLYELEQKQNKINGLSKDKALASAKIQRLTFGILALLLSSILAGLYFAYKKNKQEIQLKETFAKQLLQTQEEERQRLAKDLHDSVGQNILFIKNQLQQIERNESQLLKSVDSALDEVRNISKDLYPNQLEKYGLTAAIEALGEQVHKNAGIFVSSDLQGIDEALNKNVQINFYRIIQEFVNNTIKHADASAIRITTEHTSTQIKLIVQDNGKGFDKSILERKANTSFGLLNMEERIKMLKGKLEIESEIGKGTKSIFTIPV